MYKNKEVEYEFLTLKYSSSVPKVKIIFSLQNKEKTTFYLEIEDILLRPIELGKTGKTQNLIHFEEAYRASDQHYHGCFWCLEISFDISF